MHYYIYGKVLGITQPEVNPRTPRVELERRPQMDPRVHCEISRVVRSDAPFAIGLTVVPVQAQVYY